jgi:REP element-mobilizing transposase RayT
MWARGYLACSTGNVSSEMIVAYIENHVEEDDTFKVVNELES